MTQSRPRRAAKAVAILLIASTPSCAHVGEGDDPPAMAARIVREVCAPFVIDGLSYDEAGRRLGGWWTRNLPDPFTPPAGPIFRRSGATVQLIDGRQARMPGGALTTRPMRQCILWLDRVDETALVPAVREAVADRSDVRLLEAPLIDGALRTVACAPSTDGRVIMVNAVAHPDGKGGASVLQTEGQERCPG